jgi:minor extracellular serine protease Vpr
MTQRHLLRRARGSRILAGLGGAALVAAALAPAASGAPGDDRPQFLGTAEDLGLQQPVTSQDLAGANVETSPNAWFVQLEGAATAAGGGAAQVRSAQQALAREASASGSVDVVRTFGSLWNGASVRGQEAEVRRVAAAAGATAIFPVAIVDAPEPLAGERPDLDTALPMTGADIVHSELGFTGEGIRVAVMDTGIDYDHPDFGGAGTDGATAFPTPRVVAGYDFVGDDFNADTSAPGYNPEVRPDSDPDDCQGHGTHVAGIVGANGELTGVAPDVTFGAYRVFGCEGSTTADIMLAAMERALADDMDVLNMSIGSAFMNWSTYPTAVGADALVDEGMVVVASIGNSGASGTWSAGAPGVGEKVIGTASFDNTHYRAAKALFGDREVPYAVGSPAPAPPTSGSVTLTTMGAPSSAEARACVRPIPVDLTGKAVLIERGATPSTCDAAFYQKALAAQNAGAAAVVLYNNVAGPFNPSLAGAEPITIPVIAIGMEDGQAVANQILASGDVQLTWTDETMTAPSPTGGLISSFSSYGMAADLSLKPDIGAPGGQIYSTYPLEKGAFATLGGTSMASPHVAGAVALLLEAKPDTPATAVRDILQNHADPAVWSGNPGLGLPEAVHRQGAGMLDIDDAILATTNVTPGKLSLGESVEGGHTRTVTLANEGDSPVTYDIGYVEGIATVGTNVPGFYYGLSALEAPATVTVPAGGTAEVEVTITDGGEDLLAQYGGWIEFTADGAQTLRVPVAGFDGDYQALPVLKHAMFPTLAKLAECDRLIGADCTMGGGWDVAEEGAVFTMEDGDVPTMLVHLEHSVRSATFRVYHANADGSKGKAVHPAFNVVMQEDYLGRSGGVNVFTPWAWDGTREHNNGNDKRKVVPDGAYVVELTVVKALGDPSNPAHVETWTSPAFTIDRN